MNNLQLIHIKTVLLIFAMVLLSIQTKSQNSDTIYTKASFNGRYLKSYLTDTRDITLSPTKWSGKEWIAAGVVIGGTVALYQYDMEIRNYFQSKQTDLGTSITTDIFEPFGNNYTFATLGLFYGQGLIWKNERSKKVALLGIKAYVLSGFFVTFPKMLFNRHRPYHDFEANPNIWEGPSFPLYKSFPSGHAATSFAVAAVIASEYKETIWVPILSYSIASGVALSRMYDDKHWSSDVFMGAALGWAIGKLIHTSANWKIQTSPIVTSESAGLYMNYTF